MAASPMGNAVGVALRTAQLPKLEELSLYGNLCSTIEDCTLSGSVVAAANRVWETLGGFEQTQRFPHLTALHLCGATLGPAAAQSLGFFLVPQLRSLSLACCDLGLSEITSLAYGVMLAGEVQSSPGAPLLKELFLPGNGIENCTFSFIYIYKVSVSVSDLTFFSFLSFFPLLVQGVLLFLRVPANTFLRCNALTWVRVGTLKVLVLCWRQHKQQKPGHPSLNCVVHSWVMLMQHN